MGAAASLEHTTLSAACGEEASTTITVRNTGTLVDQFHITVLGDPGRWSMAEPASISLLPGREGTATLRFRPPRDADTPYGDLPFGVRVEPQEDPSGTTVEEGILTVLPYVDLTADLTPRTSQTYRRASHEVLVNNRGNAPVDLEYLAGDPDNLLNLTIDPAAQRVAPGAGATARVHAASRRTLWRGATQQMPFTVTVRPSAAPGVPAGEPIQLTAGVQQKPIIPPTLPRTLATIAALIIGVVVAWALVLRPTVQNAAREEVAAPLEQADQNFQKLADKVGVDVDSITGGTPSPAPTGDAAAGGDPTLGLPVSSTLILSDAPQGDPSGLAHPLAPERALTIAGLLLQNPYKDTGLLVIGTVPAGGRQREITIPEGERLVTTALDQISPTPVVFDPPLILPPGRTLAVTLACNQPGEGEDGQNRENCEITVLFTGYTRNAPTGTPTPTPS